MGYVMKDEGQTKLIIDKWNFWDTRGGEGPFLGLLENKDGRDRDDSHNFKIHHNLLLEVLETAWAAFLSSF